LTTFNAFIAASSDDAQQVGSTVTLTDSTIGLYWSDYSLGLRFQNVTIPNSATINSAKLTVNVVNTSNDTPNCTLYGEDTDDAATFTTASNNISGRTKTTASVSWTASDIGVGVKDSPDIKTIIQEIVDRAGWTSGNDLNLILQGSTTSALTIHAYDGGAGSSYYPAITIEYTTGGGDPARERVLYLSGGIEVYP